MKKLTTAVLTLIIVSCLSLVSAQTIVPGGYVSGTWNPAGSPYLVEGEITVHADSTLNINPGVTVNFQGHYKFIVNGFLEALGTETDSILFTAADTVAGWHSLRFIDAPDSSHLNYCIIQYGRATGTFPDNCSGGMACMGSNPVISHCLIRWNSAELLAGGIGTMYGSNPTFSYCMISENSAGYMNGGMGGGWVSSPVLSHCTISGNSADYMGGGFGGGEDYDPILDNCTISGNSTYSSGGGINLGTVVNPTITNCSIINNTSIIQGGGIAVNCGGLIENCTITGNSADSIGGGIIFGNDYSGTIANCTITGNSADWQGGGIYCIGDNDDATIENCTISDNTAGTHGGGIACSDSANPVIDNCTISGNSADSSGGGIYCNNSSPIIIECTLSDNTAGVDGGGIACNNYSDPTISNCYLNNNYAGEDGGGIACNFNSDPTISNCDIINNEGQSSSGGINSNVNSNPIISYCTISGNTSEYGGGIGIGPTGSPTISNCTITDNSVSGPSYHLGGGIGIFDNYSPLILISYCTITGNSALGALGGGGGIEVYNSNSVAIENCTVCMNSSSSFGSGGIDFWDAFGMSVTNTIVAGNTGYGGIFFDNAANASVSYGDFFGNENGNFTGIPPVGLGVITGVNANGDPCDDYSNIFLNAQFVEPASGDYHLMAGSPCIDAGDPLSPPDPDSTVTDIGALYYQQVMVSLTPFNPPIIIPEAGGSFDFNIAVENNTSDPQTVDIWTVIQLPLVGEMEILNVPDITVPANTAIDRDRIQQVPAFAPGGTYTICAYLGDYPWVVNHHDCFTFEKLGGDAGGYLGTPADWLCAGEPFPGEAMVYSAMPETYSLHNAYPNPFNPATNLTFALPEAGTVSLIVYDIQGREVVRLIDGFHPAGVYEATFNGSVLSSGVYFARLQADGFSQTRKLLLIK